MAIRQIVPARCGRALALEQGQAIRVINTHGAQVVDTWAFRAGQLTEFLSMEHTRATLLSMRPRVGDALYTNQRRAILSLVEDTSPGVHDTLIAACDNPRYQLLGCTTYHDNCTDNLASSMRGLGLFVPETPSPLNLFMNIPWTSEGGLSFEAPVTAPGDYVVMRAEMDCIVALSACPQDILPVNGAQRRPTEVHFEVLSAS